MTGTHEDSPLVHPPGPLLAVGPRPSVSLSGHLAIAPSVPPPGHRRRGRVSIDRSDFHVAGEDIGAVVALTVSYRKSPRIWNRP
jgi:hypothetical protein